MRFKNVIISKTKEVFFTKFKFKTPKTLIIVHTNFQVVLCTHAHKSAKAVGTCLKLKVALFIHFFVHRSAQKWLLDIKSWKVGEFCRNIVNIFYSCIYLFKKLVSNVFPDTF